MTLFDIGDIPVSAAGPILAFDPGVFTNAERVIHLAVLGYLPEPILDPTYGPGGMWPRLQPRRLVGCDNDPTRARDVRCDFTALPFKDKAFASCLFDPPYKMGGNNEWVEAGDYDPNRHYGVSNSTEVWRFISEGLAECLRVTRRFVTVKCQDQIRSGFEWQTGEVVLIARRLGWEIEDMLHLINFTAQPGVQRHARRNASTFVVLRPDRRRTL